MDKQLRDELDLFCTAFLKWGVWGNPGSEPEIILNTIAVDNALRDLEHSDYVRPMCDTVGRYVATVLRREGFKGEALDEIRRKVTNIFDIVTCSIAFERRGREALDWQRTLPLHKATDPASDPRWKLKPRRLVFRSFESETHAWVYASDAELKEHDIVVPHRSLGMLDIHLLHRDDGPALIFYHNKKVVEEVWVYKGRMHRTDGPAHTLYGAYRRWYLDDILQSEEEDAVDDSTDQP